MKQWCNFCGSEGLSKRTTQLSHPNNAFVAGNKRLLLKNKGLFEENKPLFPENKGHFGENKGLFCEEVAYFLHSEQHYDGLMTDWRFKL